MSIQSSTRQHDANYQVALVLQGGGALGALRIGAYQALHEAGYEPDWVSGISIGAVNAALIAGNQPDARLGKLTKFWDEISRPDGWGAAFGGDLRQWFNWGSVTEAVLFGQPQFFSPRFPNPYCAPPGTPGATSFYDTSPLRSTLERLADFDLINSGHVRLSLGATRVRTGELVFFDSHRQRIAPEHVMASGSLPPGFPATQVEGEMYWDGGCVSNTPLGAINEDPPSVPTLVFMIDLFNPEGPEPATLDEVLWRQKQIQFASRTTHAIDSVAKQHRLRYALSRVSGQLPTETPRNATAQRALEQEYGEMCFCRIIYEPRRDQIPMSDAEFSRPSIADRRAAGYSDMMSSLRQKPWLSPVGEAAESVDRGAVAPVGAFVYECRRGRISRRVLDARPAIQGPRERSVIGPLLTSGGVH